IDVAIYARALARAPTQTTDDAAVLIAAIDITERKQSEARVAYMAHHDTLTGLPNRVQLRRHMAEKLQQALRTGAGIATLIIDLDNFKGINDTFGHACGDELLHKVAERVRGVLRSGDAAARLAGDEFAVLLALVDGPQEVGMFAETL